MVHKLCFIVIVALSLILTSCNPPIFATPEHTVLPCDGSGVTLSAWVDLHSLLDAARDLADEPDEFWAYLYALDRIQPLDGAWLRGGDDEPVAVGATYLATAPGTYKVCVRIINIDDGGLEHSDWICSGEVVASSPDLCHERADVSVVIYGGWDGIPVNTWVGGTEQETLYTARDASGEAAVLWSFFPFPGMSWKVTVAPELPPGVDAAEWEYRLVRIVSTTGLSVDEPVTAELTLAGGGTYTVYYQLMHTGAAGQ
jgi:hypothetical protein